MTGTKKRGRSLAGVTAGGIASFSADLVSAVAFSISVIVPFMVRLFVAEDSLLVTMGTASMLYLGFMFMSLWRINRNILENITLRIEATERERTVRASEEELRTNAERMRGLYELSPVGIALTDMEGNYVEFNESFRRICGYTEQELKLLDYWSLTPKKYEAAEALQLESLSHTGRYGPYEKEYLRKDGSLVPLRLNGMLVTGRDGQKQIWSIVEDISDSKSAAENMRIAATAF